MINCGLMSSATPEWGTPRDLFERLDRLFGPFDLDVCASPGLEKCSRYFTPEVNGLAQRWAPARCWMNPPYGRGIGAWVGKAWAEASAGAVVCALLPARTDAAWFQDYCLDGALFLLRGRVRFEAADGRPLASAPFPSCVVVWPPASAGLAAGVVLSL